MKFVIANAMLAGLREEEFSSLVAQLRTSAAEVHLSGIPPVSDTSWRIQLLTGLSPEWTGGYDEFRVLDYQVFSNEVSPNVEEQFLWKRVEAMGRSSIYVKDELPTSLSDLIYLEVHSSHEVMTALYEASDEETVKALILPDPPVQRNRGVNINNFFEARGLLERGDDGGIRWEETIAYHVGHGQVWINLLGREPNGVVSPGQEYSEVREALLRILKEQLLNGKAEVPVIANVWCKEALYDKDGRLFVSAPDLVVSFQPGYCPSPQSVHLGFDIYGAEFPPIENYNTPMKATMFISGRGIQANYSGTGYLTDLVPTAMYMLDLPIPHILSGKIIKEIFKPAFWDNRRPRYQQVEGELTSEEEALLLDRLEALGYIE